MSKFFNFIVLLMFGMLGSSVFAADANQVENPLLGSWRLASVTYKSEERSSTIEEAQPGIFLFTPDSYAIMWTPLNRARTPFKVLSNPTDEEAIAGFKSVVFNGGSYQFDGDGMTTKAFIAKVPGFEGGLQHYRYDVNGDQLHLTMFDETYPDGSKPDWSGIWETEFVLERVK